MTIEWILIIIGVAFVYIGETRRTGIYHLFGGTAFLFLSVTINTPIMYLFMGLLFLFLFWRSVNQ
jgi:hypothetical protein